MSCPTSIKDKCYNTMVSTQIEYASNSWEPCVKNVDKINVVPRRAARFMTSNCSLTSSVTVMNNRFGWESS